MSTQPKATFYNLKPYEGFLKVHPPINDEEMISKLTANLVSISIIRDTGTPKKNGKRGVDPHDALLVTLKDPNLNELYCIKSKIGINFTNYFALQLSKVEHNAELTINVRVGNEPKVTLISMLSNGKPVEFTKFESDINIRTLLSEHPNFKNS